MEQHSSIHVTKTENEVTATSRDGRSIASGVSGTDDASVLQAAVDALGTGGEVFVAKGRYVLDRPVVVTCSATVSGEGRNTILVPPRADFAIRVTYTETCAFVRPDVIDVPGEVRTLIGVVLRDFTIDGERHGKGIYLYRIKLSTLERLWILNTYDGAGLYVHFVCESSFRNLRMEMNGNGSNGEAALVISRDDDQGSDNLTFDTVEVTFPLSTGIDIGWGDGKNPPRLIFFKNCQFHGLLPMPEVKPFDMLLVRDTADDRGIVVESSRLTHCGEHRALVHVVRGEAKILNNVVGKGHAACLVEGEKEAKLDVRGNTFLDVSNPRGEEKPCVHATGSHLIFCNNTVTGQGGGLRLTAVRSAIVTGNRFENEVAGSAVHILGDGERSSENAIVSDNVFAGAAGEAIQIEPRSTGAIEVHGNVFAGRYGNQPIRR